MPVRRVSLWVAVLAVGIAGAMLWLFGARHPRVLLVGVDGADPAIVERLIAEGKLPTFSRLRQGGAFGRLRSREPLLSPLLWTTIATGRKPQDHGVLDFVEAASDGRVVPITSSRRRVPALWNIATQFGRSSGFIGWYATFPVERVRGFEVSDRIGFHQVSTDQAAEGTTFPPELAASLQRRVGRPTVDIATVRALFASAGPMTIDGERRLSQLARMYATTEYYRRIAVALQRDYRPDLSGVYFEWIDACSHLFMEDAPPRRQRIADEDYGAFSATVDRCYAYQDEVLAELVSAAGDDSLVIVCSDHGFKSGDRRPDTPGRADDGQAALWHLPNGLVLMHGRTVQRASSIVDATVLDIAPTILRALGLPVARDLSGRPIRQAFVDDPSPNEPARIPKYDWVPVPAPQPAAADAPDRLADLRALGYVTGSDDTQKASDGRFASSFLNEGVALYVDGEQRDALRAFARAAQLDAANVNARAFAARIHLERREFDIARPLLDEAVRLDPRSAYVRLLRANLAIGTREWPAAENELAAAAAIDSRLPMLYIQRARLLDARHDPAGAVVALATAETLTDAEPLLLDILMLRADAMTRLARPSEADAAIARASKLAPADQIAAARAELALARDDAAAALGFVRAAIEKNSRSARLWSLLGAIYGRMEQFDPAISAYEQSIQIEPTALACKTLAALVFEIHHDRAKAVKLWQQSLELDRHQPDVQQFLSRYGGELSGRSR